MYPSQRIQESCQSGTRWLMETQVKVRRKRGAQKDRGSLPPSLNQKNTRLCRANRDARAGGHPRLSGQMGPHAHRHQRLRREAAPRSPCSSTDPLCSPRQVVSEPSVISLSVPQVSKVLPGVNILIHHILVLAQVCPKASGDMRKNLSAPQFPYL